MCKAEGRTLLNTMHEMIGDVADPLSAYFGESDSASLDIGIIINPHVDSLPSFPFIFLLSFPLFFSSSSLLRPFERAVAIDYKLCILLTVQYSSRINIYEYLCDTEPLRPAYTFNVLKLGSYLYLPDLLCLNRFDCISHQ